MDELIDFTELKAAGLLPAPATATLDLLTMDPDEGLDAQLAALASRPGLAKAVLHLTGMAGNDALPAALAVVGHGTLCQLAIALDLASQYRRGACPNFDFLRFWSRSFASACAAQALAAEMPVTPASTLFCHGLLADVGHMALATSRPRSYGRLLRENTGAGAGTGKLLRDESALYGYSHLSLGATLLRSWQLGHAYSDAVLYKEAPHMAQDRQTRHLARVLQLAGCMADLLLAPPEEHREIIERMASVSQRLQLDSAVLLEMVDGANSHWQQWCRGMDLPTRADPPIPAPAAAMTAHP